MDREELLRSARNLYENPGTNEALKVVLEDTYPELKESEDEKIRKHLIEIVDTYWGKTNDPGKAADLAYLEKQKEQKPLMCDGEIEDKYGQKMLCVAYRLMYEHIPENLRTQEFWDSLKFMREYTGKAAIVQFERPAEWSEEDVEMLESIIKDYDYLCRIWLQDYEKRLGGADCEARIDIRNQITWLKSLRPQPHWKPSDEQMEWLESAVRLSTDKPRIHGIIISLYEQLKRLSL